MKAGVISSVLIWSRRGSASSSFRSSPASWRRTLSESSERKRTRPGRRVGSDGIPPGYDRACCHGARCGRAWGASRSKRRQAPRNGVGFHDRRARFGLVGDAIENLIELFDRSHTEPGDEAIVPRHLVALADFRKPLKVLLDDLQLARQGPDADDGLQLVAEKLGVDLDGESADDAPFLEAAQPLGNTGGGKANLAGQVLQGHPRVFRQGREQALIHFIRHFTFL